MVVMWLKSSCSHEFDKSIKTHEANNVPVKIRREGLGHGTKTNSLSISPVLTHFAFEQWSTRAEEDHNTCTRMPVYH